MDVSVVIPAYNAARFVRQAIDSVLHQTHAPLEVLVVDDGSQDDTPEIVESYADGAVRLIRQPNQGPSAARNTGIAAARGTLIAFLDADDSWLPDKLARQVALLAAHPSAAFCITDERLVGEDGTVFQESYLAEALFRDGKPDGPALVDKPLTRLMAGTFVGTSTVCARTECVRAAGIFDVQLRLVEDRDMWIRLACQGPVGVVPEVLAHKMEDHGGNISKGVTNHFWASCVERVIDRHRSAAWSLVAAEGTPPRRLFAHVYRDLGSIYWYHDDFAGARRCLGRAIGYGAFDEAPRWLASLFGRDAAAMLRRGRRALRG